MNTWQKQELMQKERRWNRLWKMGECTEIWKWDIVYVQVQHRKETFSRVWLKDAKTHWKPYWQTFQIFTESRTKDTGEGSIHSDDKKWKWEVQSMVGTIDIGEKETFADGCKQTKKTHPSTNPAQSCLTSVIRREPVHSAWYGRRTLKHIYKAFYIAGKWQKDYRRWENTLRWQWVTVASSIHGYNHR